MLLAFNSGQSLEQLEWVFIVPWMTVLYNPDYDKYYYREPNEVKRGNQNSVGREVSAVVYHMITIAIA